MTKIEEINNILDRLAIFEASFILEIKEKCTKLDEDALLKLQEMLTKAEDLQKQKLAQISSDEQDETHKTIAAKKNKEIIQKIKEHKEIKKILDKIKNL